MKIKIRPRCQIGPDALRQLNNLSMELTDNSRSFNGCRVQRDATGGPSATIDVTALEDVGHHHPESYDTFIRGRLDDKAYKLAKTLSTSSQAERASVLSDLLKEAVKDGETWWLLSFPQVRRYLFPAAFSGYTRADNLYYPYRPKDPKRNQVIPLPDLKPNSVQRLVSQAKSVIKASAFDPALITPIQLQKAEA